MEYGELIGKLRDLKLITKYEYGVFKKYRKCDSLPDEHMQLEFSLNVLKKQEFEFVLKFSSPLLIEPFLYGVVALAKGTGFTVAMASYTDGSVLLKLVEPDAFERVLQQLNILEISNRLEMELN